VSYGARFLRVYAKPKWQEGERAECAEDFSQILEKKEALKRLIKEQGTPHAYLAKPDFLATLSARNF
jgi:hypothetical protein